MGRPQNAHDLVARRREVVGQVHRVDEDDGVSAGIGQPGGGQVADDKACPVRPVACLLDGDGREVHPDEGDTL